jgi:hypothetical protein
MMDFLNRPFPNATVVIENVNDSYTSMSFEANGDKTTAVIPNGMLYVLVIEALKNVKVIHRGS